MKLENPPEIIKYTKSNRQVAKKAKRTHGIIFYHKKVDLFQFGVYKTSIGVVYMKIEGAFSKKCPYAWPEEVKEMTFEDEEKMDRCIKVLAEKVFAVKHTNNSQGPIPIKHRIVYEDEFVQKIDK